MRIVATIWVDNQAEVPDATEALSSVIQDSWLSRFVRKIEIMDSTSGCNCSIHRHHQIREELLDK